MGTRVLRAALVAFLLGTSVATASVSAQELPIGPFADIWARSDAPVTIGFTDRTWMWGPGPYSVAMTEPYADALGGERDVQYFDKSRMEINDLAGDQSSLWFVTNGLLAQELITGQMQIGDNEFAPHEPAHVQVAGDQHPDSPTYAMLAPLLNWGALPEGSPLLYRLHSDGSVQNDDSLANYGAVAAHFVPETDHTVAGPFWEFMTSRGEIYHLPGGYTDGPLFHNPFFATGFPITEAYWVDVPVAGQRQDVLVQCFERRCLTYTPTNSPGWQVEAGNIGQHYYIWRYGEPVPASPDAFLPPGISGPPPPSPWPGCVDINRASVEELTQIVHIDTAGAQQIIERREQFYITYIDHLQVIVSGIGPAGMQDIQDQGLACVDISWW